jgi:uncharacterized DUF497 family protein
MGFEWDEDKRLRNIAKHGLDFVRAQLVFDGRPFVTASSRHLEEERWLTTAIVDDRYLTVIWTDRGNTIRIISARSARDAEKRTYREIHG